MIKNGISLSQRENTTDGQSGNQKENSLIYSSSPIKINPANPHVIRQVVRFFRDNPGHSILETKKMLGINRSTGAVPKARAVAEAVEMLEVAGYVVKRDGGCQRYYLTTKGVALCSVQ